MEDAGARRKTVIAIPKKYLNPLKIAFAIIVVISFYYFQVYQPHSNIIGNCRKFIAEESALIQQGKLGLAEKDIGWIDEGIAKVQTWYTFPTLKTRLRGIEAKSSEMKRIVGSTIKTADFDEIIRLGKEANYRKHALIAEKASSLIHGARKSISGFPAVRGKVLVWDYTKKTVEQAYGLLRDALRASPADTNITIFAIRRRWNVQVGTYSISRAAAFQEHMEIGVVYWPEIACLGYSEITGGMPALMRSVTYTPEYGSSASIKNWIEGHLR